MYEAMIVYVPASIFSILNLPSLSEAAPKLVPFSVILAKERGDWFDLSRISPSSLYDCPKTIWLVSTKKVISVL
jgi:hypothetical protein